jgi:hypothetical protein
VRRAPRRVLLEAARLTFAGLVAFGSAEAFESTCPAPMPENSSPGCEGPSLVFGASVGFVGALLLTVVGEWVWRRRKRRILG